MAVAVGRGFDFDPGDTSVGLWPGWMHVVCPEYLSTPDPADWPADHVLGGWIEEYHLASVRIDSMSVRHWTLLTCRDCAQQVIVYESVHDPSPEEEAAMARDEEEAMRQEAMAEAELAHYDDDPNPYHGDYSEC